jgi:hypothetical protein
VLTYVFFFSASDIAVSAWGSQSEKILLYGQSDDGMIHEYKYDDGKWTHLGRVARARPATPIAVTSNRENWVGSILPKLPSSRIRIYRYGPDTGLLLG